MTSEGEVFEMFDGKYAVTRKYAEFEGAERKRLARRFPPLFLSLLDRDGFAAYNDGFLWTCDPDAWNEYLKPWFPRGTKWEAFMRTAFGETFLWNGKEVWLAKVNDAQTIYCSARFDIFLAGYLTFDSFLKESGRMSEFRKALRKAGPVASDEIYIWVPSLLLGGSPRSSTIEKGNAAVALDILSQQTEINVEAD